MEKICCALSERTVVAENLTKYLREIISKIEPENQRRNPELARESPAAKMTEIECRNGSLVKRSRDLEEGANDGDVCKEGKRRRVVAREEEMRSEREEFLSSVKRREDQLDAELVAVRRHIECLEAAQTEVHSMRRLACVKLKEMESREQKLAEKERKVDLIVQTLDGRVIAVEKKEREFKIFLEGKMREIVLKEKELSIKREKFCDEVKLEEEKFTEQEKIRRGFFERLERAEEKLECMRAAIDERFEEIEYRENVIRESMENQLEEFERGIRDFSSFQEDKMRELVSKEQQLEAMSKKLVEDAKLRDEQLTERESLVHKLLERLEVAQDNVENMKKIVHQRFKEIALKEDELNSIRDWVERKIDEVDGKKVELEEREKRIRKKKDNVLFEEKEIRRKKQKLDLEEDDLQIWENELKDKQREVDLVQKSIEQRFEELDRREKNLNSVRDFTRNCFKQHRDLKKKLLLERNSVELKNQELENMVRELKLKHQGQSDDLNARVRTDANESADVLLTVKMDGKTLQMFLNDPQKDLESMGDEIFTVLHLSSDPAKLVLDAMVGFYPPHLREEDVEFNVRKTCIILLQQLIRMSQEIQPCVREEAMALAGAWKSKMRASGENHLEVLGFLHLLAAYDLTSYFDKDEILGFVKIVARYRQTTDLCPILGFAESITGQSTFVAPTIKVPIIGNDSCQVQRIVGARGHPYSDVGDGYISGVMVPPTNASCKSIRYPSPIQGGLGRREK